MLMIHLTRSLGIFVGRNGETWAGAFLVHGVKSIVPAQLGWWREGLSYHNVPCLVWTFAAMTQMTQTDTDQICEELLMS